MGLALGGTAAIFGMLYVLAVHGSAVAVNSVSNTDEKLPETAKLCPDCSRPSTNAGEFLAGGGKAVIEVSVGEEVVDAYGEQALNAMQKVEASRGSAIIVPLTLTYVPGADSLPVITMVGVGINNGFIPSYAASSLTAEERLDAVKSGKPIPGALDLNSMVGFSPKVVTLKPNESATMNMTITIPKDLPDQIVGSEIPFSVLIGEGQSYDYRDVLVKQTLVTVRVVG